MHYLNVWPKFLLLRNGQQSSILLKMHMLASGMKRCLVAPLLILNFPAISRIPLALSSWDRHPRGSVKLNVYLSPGITVPEVNRNNTWRWYPLNCQLFDFHENELAFRTTKIHGNITHAWFIEQIILLTLCK